MMDLNRRPHLYEPLDATKSEFRILKLFPAEDHKSPVRVELFNACLENPPAYDAISYVWGDPCVTVSINVDGNPEFDITTNAEMALRDLRSSTGVMNLWMDAVCINQLNILERNHQVSLMFKIYSQAAVVRVWLDFTIDLNDPIFKIITNRMRRDSTSHFWPVSEKDLPELASGSGWEDFNYNPYWSRVWIQQELAYSKNTSIHCRRTEIDKWAINNFCQLMSSQPVASHRKVDRLGRIESAMEMQKWARLYPFRLREVQAHLAGPFHCPGYGANHGVLIRGSWLKSSDPRDKVHALVPLSASWRESDFPLDYQLSTTEVYANAAAWMIESDRSIQFLHSNSLDQSLDGLHMPSWVPDWRISAVNIYIMRVLQYSPRISTFHDRDFREMVEMDQGKKYLRVNGFRLRNLQKLWKRACCGISGIENMVSFRPAEYYDTILEWADIIGFNPEQNFDLLFKIETRNDGTISGPLFPLVRCKRLLRVLNDLNTPNPENEEWCESFQLWFLEALLTVQVTVLLTYIGILKNEDFNFQAGKFSKIWDPLFLILVQMMGTPKSIFVTERDELGRTEVSASLKDQVWILIGCPFPMLLRPEGQFYKVVGPAYIDNELSQDAEAGLPEFSFGDTYYKGHEIRSIVLI